MRKIIAGQAAAAAADGLSEVMATMRTPPPRSPMDPDTLTGKGASTDGEFARAVRQQLMLIGAGVLVLSCLCVLRGSFNSGPAAGEKVASSSSTSSATTTGRVMPMRKSARREV